MSKPSPFTFPIMLIFAWITIGAGQGLMATEAMVMRGVYLFNLAIGLIVVIDTAHVLLKDFQQRRRLQSA